MRASVPAVPVPYEKLVALLGKRVDDPAVNELLAKAGKVTIKPDYVIAKEAGFDFSLDRPEGAKRKVLSTLFLFPDGYDRHRGYADLPEGFAFSTRAELLATLPAPESSWKIGKGKVPVSTDGVAHDTWSVGGLDVCVSYRQGDEVSHIQVSRRDEEGGGQDLSTHPLHFETKPADAPEDAELVGMALLVAWGAVRFGLPKKHAGTRLGERLLAREITPRTFLIEACGKRLSSLDFDPKLGDFLYEYIHQVRDDEGARAKADAQIAKLLRLEGRERRVYTDDFLGTFRKAVDDPFHVPDGWEALERITPVIDARLADFEATGFLEPPELALYEKAAKLRDAVSVEPARRELAAAVADAKLADDLVALIGKSLKDPGVKAVLQRAGLPVGKRIDEQANPALGVSYMGTKIDVGGIKQLGVDGVTFYADKQKSYIRGIGAEVQFVGYPGPLPRGLVFGESRAAVAKKLGKPKSSYEDNDYWQPAKNRRWTCEFEKGKLVQIYVGIPGDY